MPIFRKSTDILLSGCRAVVGLDVRVCCKIIGSGRGKLKWYDPFKPEFG